MPTFCLFPVDELKDRAIRVVEVQFGDRAPSTESLEAIENVVSVTARRTTTLLRVEGGMDALIKHLAQFEVVAMRSEEADLEEVFLDLYREEAE